jgi:hypothetical protein
VTPGHPALFRITGPLLAGVLVGLPACGPADDGDDIAWRRHSLTAFCQVNVTGKGLKQVETDYLPHVIACENGGADMEALKAQAVAARSFMRYKIKQNGGSICDSQSCQVYSCSNQPKQKHYDAVSATAGQVLVHSGVVICAFYVAGAKPSTNSCKALSSDPDPTNTEKYVTYNSGKSGNSVIQSTLGWVSSTNKYNRGCKSQNGAHCLSLKGKSYSEILRYYYGDDIQLVTSTGSCVSPPPPDPDQGVPEPQDPDQGAPEPPDPEPPALDGSVPSEQDSLPPQNDAGAPTPGSDGLPPSYQSPGSGPQTALRGGCSLGGHRGTSTPGTSVLLLLLVLVVLVRGATSAGAARR